MNDLKDVGTLEENPVGSRETVIEWPAVTEAITDLNSRVAKLEELPILPITHLRLTKGDILVIKDAGCIIDADIVDVLTKELEVHFGFKVPVMVIDGETDIKVVHPCTPENPCFYEGCPDCKGGPFGCE